MNHNQIRVLISSVVDQSLIDFLDRNPIFSYKYIPRASPMELAAEISTVEILICRIDTPIDSKVLASAPYLRLVATATAGVNHIDIEAVSERQISLVHCPGENSRSTAEFALGLMLATLRKIPQARDNLIKGYWQRHLFVGEELQGKLVAVWGFGAIGKIVAKLCFTFGARVRVYDHALRSQDYEAHQDYEFVEDLDSLAKGAEILTLHVPVLACNMRGCDYIGVADQASVNFWLRYPCVNTASGNDASI